MADIDNRILIGIFGLIAGIYGWLIKHLSNHKKHPCSDDIVYKDVCQAQRDCIETSVKDLKEYSKERFDRIEELIKNERI